MSSMDSFMSKFGGCPECECLDTPSLLPSTPNGALGAFMDKFSPMTESFWFYGHTIEIQYNAVDHIYYRVDPELGNLIELYGVTNVLKIIDKSASLTPWAAKMTVEKLLRTIPLAETPDEFGSIRLAPMTLEEFTKLCMEAKDAHKERLDEAGDIGHLAHKTLEDSIQYAIDHTGGIVLELRSIPEDEKARNAANSAFAWMQAHSVRWRKTEQKVYSKEYDYSGTMDGECLVNSCDDPACCSEHFVDSLSIADWKSSNALHVEYIFQAAGAYHHAVWEEFGEDFQNCFILRLGKNADEAGKFEPWRIPARDFPEAFRGFLTCLELVKIVASVKERMSLQKKGVREAKKIQKAEQKEIAKMQAKVEKEAAKAQLKLDRAAERERIKSEAKAAREAAKLANNTKVIVVGTVDTPVLLEKIPESQTQSRSEVEPTTCDYEEASIPRRMIIPEEG